MSKRNCVISAVGKNSLHRMWTKGDKDFDLHLIVYDDSLEQFRHDAKYACHIKGYKLKVIYKYLEANPQFKDMYDYFFLPDDDILMDTVTINALFEAMKRYDLKIAQPALRMSYYTWPHTLYDRYSRLRYTNFVEMMVPCFCREALQKVLFTFNENETGWGTETHWPLLIDASLRDMAIIDEISVIHTHPIQSGQAIHKKELAAYLNKFGLKTQVCSYDVIPARTEQKYCCDRTVFSTIRDMLLHWINNERITAMYVGENGYLGYVHFLFLIAGITQARKYADVAIDLLARIQDGLGMVKNDMTFGRGITGCSWLIEYLAGEKLLDEDPQELLSEIETHIRHCWDENAENLTVAELAGIGKYWLVRLRNRPDAGLKATFLTLGQYLKSRLSLPQSFYDIRVYLDALEILKACGEDIFQYVTSLERVMMQSDLLQVEYAYSLFRLYVITNDEHLYVCVRERLKNLVPQLLDLPDALMLAEILYHKNNPNIN